MNSAIASKRIHRGKDLREVLRQEALLEEAESRALMRAIALQLDRLRKEQRLSRSRLAMRMKTSRAAVDHLLDPANPSISLATLVKAAHVLKRRLQIELVLA